MPPQVDWDDLPPNGERLPLAVYTIAPGPAQFIRFLGRVQGVWSHWTGQRTVPCFKSGCAFCPDPRRRWTGYAPAQVYRQAEVDPAKRWLMVILNVSEGLASLLGPGLARGQVWKIGRRGATRNSGLVAELLEQPLDPSLPEGFSVRPHLERLWGLRLGKNASKPASADDQEPPGTIPFAPPAG